MQNNIIISSFILISITSLSQVATSEEKQPLHITIHNHNDGATSSSTSHNESTSEQKTDSSANAQSTNYAEMIHLYYDTCKQSALEHYQNMLKHKYKIIAALSLTLYAQTQYRLYKIHTLLDSPRSWCNWKSITPTEQLVCISHEELIPLLLCDMQKKYLLLPPKNRIESYIDHFIKEVSNELALLQGYITMQKYANMLYLSKLFYFSHKKSFVQEKINRLHIILDIFISWQTKELLK